MYVVEFDYPVKNMQLKIIARCKEIHDIDDIKGLSLSFWNGDNKIKMLFDQEMFDDLADEAAIALSEQYFNGNNMFPYAKTH